MRWIGLRALMVALLMSSLGAGAAGQAGPVPVGQPASFFDENGLEQGLITVTEIVDPFTGFREGYEPPDGARYVMVVMSFEGTGDEGIQAYPPSIYLHTATGATYGDTTIQVPDDFDQPDLSIQSVGPGSRISGFVSYVVPEDGVVDGVLVSADGTLVIPADLGMQRPAIDQPVTLTAQDGATVEAVVDTVTDPYKKFDKGRPPADGGRFVLVSASLENTGEGPFRVERNGFLLRDVNGKLWGLSAIEHAKKPKQRDIDSSDLASGDRVSGLLPFQVPKDVALEALYYQGDGGFYRLASLSDAGSSPVAVAGATCEEMTAWWAVVNPSLQRLVALPPFQPDSGPMDEAASAEMLEELQAIRSEVSGVEVPATLIDVHGRALGALLLYERSATEQVTAARDADLDALALGHSAFDAAQLVMADALAALSDLGYDDCEQP